MNILITRFRLWLGSGTETRFIRRPAVIDERAAGPRDNGHYRMNNKNYIHLIKF